jgi:hypothetical protein
LCNLSDWRCCCRSLAIDCTDNLAHSFYGGKYSGLDLLGFRVVDMGSYDRLCHSNDTLNQSNNGGKIHVFSSQY